MAKFKLIRQHDAMECGIASLAMICRYYGKNIPLRTLSKLCIPTINGSSLKGISDACTELGLESMCGYLSISDIIKINKPLILHWNRNHFVVLYKVNRNKNVFYIADPAKGYVKLTLEDFKNYWISSRQKEIPVGVGMYIEPTDKFYEIVVKDVHSNYKDIYKYLKGYKKYFIHLFLGLVLGACLQLCLPFLMQSIVDVGVKRHDINIIILILIGELLIVFGKTTTEFIRNRILLHISMRINLSLVSDFFRVCLITKVKFRAVNL